jgi:hypothetical protein
VKPPWVVRQDGQSREGLPVRSATMSKRTSKEKLAMIEMLTEFLLEKRHV